ncbi:M20/M25/M40 family metallo-hydrolase [Deltaproteobacteria bacterium OttesenSCG-928-K17]|nr:M20/M25/M40 family metallo-hydrolase [Deltaproteobacteria bacterium OttesenSCG-928-K17]
MSQPKIIEEFLELVQVPAHSRRERALADVMTLKLKEMGFEVEEDDTGSKIGGDCGNLIARLKGDAAIAPIMFSAHLDRVENHGAIKPQIEGGVIKSDGSSILAADDVSGICAILDGIRRVQAENIPHGDLEIVLSVAEEVGLLGARHLDYSKIKSKKAYVIDTGGPLGTIVNQCPTQYTMTVTVHGRSAHAGIEPEKGLNAIRVAAAFLARVPEGRLSPGTTSNYGIISGGKATNIVCDLTEIQAEARSIVPGELDAYMAEVHKIAEATAKEFNTNITVSPNTEYLTFKVDEQDEVIKLAATAMRNMGLSAKVVSGGGGMDGNFFNQHGIKSVGLSPGYVGVHTPAEQQPIEDLIKCGQLVTEIIRASAG